MTDRTAHSPGTKPETSGSFFGRRKGKALRQHQGELIEQMLPRLRLPEGPIPDATALFPLAVTQVRLEIGFGGGEHLLARMRENPQIGFIGCEPFVNGMAKFLGAIERENLRNVRLWDGDAALLLPRLPAASLSEVALLYPDPWPKRRHRKRRFVSDATLAALARLLRPGGRFLFASDIDDYVGWTLARLLRSPDFDWRAEGPDDWRPPYPDWVRTRYEAKAIAAGRVPSYLTAIRR